VVETGSFTAAAQALQTAKSSVSETVRAREERMGVRLLDRTIRSVRLTEAGAAFYRHCRRLIGDMDSARREAQAAHKTPAGRLHCRCRRVRRTLHRARASRIPRVSSDDRDRAG
jgi:DNA-binding transcriptional LysR family regulator